MQRHSRTKNTHKKKGKFENTTDIFFNRGKDEREYKIFHTYVHSIIILRQSQKGKWGIPSLEYTINLYNEMYRQA